MVTLEMVRKDEEVKTFIRHANRYLRALGFTDHGKRHSAVVADTASAILSELGYDAETCELAAIAGYMHDMGNAIHREHHAQSGSLVALPILKRLGMAIEPALLVCNAIGNHEEERGYATTPISAALNIADKSDVHRSRVHFTDGGGFDNDDIHDRVNYATTRRRVLVDAEAMIITIDLTIDTSFSPVIEYFEIFLDRMRMVRQAAEFLGCRFQLIINGTEFS